MNVQESRSGNVGWLTKGTEPDVEIRSTGMLQHCLNSDFKLCMLQKMQEIIANVSVINR